ncbi:hypothetical protein KY285_024031 [Solanum tuberosum]|nr:hypothetical protein KY285_024031 [Solanum tuberosum]
MKLIGLENYGVWRRSMRLTHLVKNNLGFVDGTCAKSSYKKDLAIRWERCDVVVLPWINAAVAPELMTSIVYASSSKKIWNDFKERFDKSNFTRIFHPWKEINMIHQGLNESYAQVRSSILLSATVPSVNQAYAMAIQEASQRRLGQAEGGKDPLTMMAGHTKDTCYRIVSFPTDFKSKRKPSANEDNMSHANVSAVTSSDSEKNEGSSSKFYFPRGYFTRDHYDQLLSMVDPPTGTCKDNALAEVIGIGKEEEGLYILRHRHEVTPIIEVVLKEKNSVEHRLWHLRLGHPSIKVMKHLSMLKNTVDANV